MVLISLYSYAQEIPQNEEDNFWRNVQFGGGLGLSFANGFFSATVAPQGVYNFNERFGLGIGLNATVNSQKNRFKSTILGGSIIGLYNPLREIQLSTEFEQLNVNRNFDENFVSNIDDNFWNSALFIGVGYRTNNVIFGIRYDVLYDEEKSIYAEPWLPFIRFWF
ncbi:alpha-ketoglutarate decarboxylase [Ichthyenterobacterium sp. W332]|uniref:Alpha-ketoglutarate decarboxylase n=1 Tax=Microcosmobacter mediterraneus TaxID=3075607 RepID=A0ABU2YI70_9FLAO|nr:alpha-ketoglutarate decarboxylase [Ichthyenterobacterium sp. W332]MDT0557871.1 alpha-ketoglutarate decarboxylase [Ichthyenterobacterium sp. W332]